MIKDSSYYRRLAENRKVRELDAKVAASITLENRAIIEDAKRIVQIGLDRGWIKKPTTIQDIQ